MFRRLATIVVGFALALAATSALAFTPESGFYWNPAESGSGLAIEIQDNYVFLTGYVYDTQGRPTWVSSQGLLTGNDRFTGTLDQFINGQCIGCAYRAPTAQLGVGGPISLSWTSETTATLVWGSRTIPLQRFDYYLTRTAGIDANVEKLLGEWQVVIDFYTNTGSTSYQAFPYYGDVFVLKTIDTATSPDQAKGCRPRDTDYSDTNGPCTAAEITAHDAAANYAPVTTTTPPGSRTHNIVVRDDPSNFFAYFVTVGTYQFDGVVEICAPGTCGRPTSRYYPVRGFRTASRKFVQSTDGSGPSSSEKSAATATATQGIAAALARNGEMPRGLTAAEVQARYGFDPAQQADNVNALIATMGAR